ncbi:pectinesterase family protein [Segetibacter sp. 3557_3]|uniref:pectinesterase family protein n=1 Tax=Segetibacter sp. 3557_3 TaxID=2547429 RepID=UPI0014042735|nr:pectinesterase family protein [Segetibacter sp. 3557_3]
MKIFTHPFKGFAFVLFLLLSSLGANAYDLVVAKDGSGDYTTVQAAINAAPTGRTAAYTIYIKNGKYKEKINVPANKPFLQFIGESVANVILTYDDYSGKPMPGGGTYGTSNSASVTINAANFTAVNVTFENTTGEAPQALAINVNADRAAFKNCRFLGGQDTVLTNAAGRLNYFRNCYIDGTVDFIFGNARAVFDSCVIYGKTRSSAGASYITAANTQQAEPYGYVFRDSKIPANRGGTIYFLGRPWQNDASTADVAKSWNKVVFLNTVMSSSIQPAGWSTWDAGTDVTKITYAEYKSRKFDGSLVDVSQRVPWSNQLTDAEAQVFYNNTTLFGNWDPCTTTPDFCAYVPAPIAVTNFRGVKGTSTTNFTWNMSWAIPQVKFEVLRSADKVTFTPVSEQTSSNDSLINFSYSETIPPPGVTYHYLVRASKQGYETHISSDTVSISSTPTINVTGSFGSFIQGLGTPSTSQSYVVSGSSLTGNLVVLAPQNYQLSTDGVNWSSGRSFVPDALGNVPNTSISVRLNATTAGTYNGQIIHSSTGADSVRVSVTGTVQNDPLTVSSILEWWPMTTNNQDSASVRSAGVIGTTPIFSRLTLSNGTTVPAVPAYSPTFGQAFAVTPDGLWTTGAGGPGGNLNRTFYEQFTLKAAGTHTLRVDSLILNSSFYNTESNTRFAVVYSKTGFTTADSTSVTGGVGPDGLQLPATANGDYPTPVLLANETSGTNRNYRFALAGGTGVSVNAGDSLVIRLYYSSGSGSNGRYAKLKNVQLKGLATANPVSGDYRSRQSGDWTNLSTWERYDGSNWITPAPAYPVYNNSGTTTILNGHAVTVSASLTNGSGYIHLTKVNRGGQLIVSNGASLNLANDGAPSTATTDLQVDGTFTLFGGLFTNGNVSVVVNGTFVNSGTNMNLSNGGDSVFVGENATWQHNVNNGNTPARMVWAPTSLFLITGITTNQTGIFKKEIRYGNIEWNNTGQTNYYAFRNTLDSANVQGSFLVRSTGTSNITFTNAPGRVKLPGGFVQVGGIVNFRENGNFRDTLEVGGQFVVLPGVFNSNASAANPLFIKLTGVNKNVGINNFPTNTSLEIAGNYRLISNIMMPTAGFGMRVSGTLATVFEVVRGAGDFFLLPGATLDWKGPNIGQTFQNTGTISLSQQANFVYDNSSEVDPKVTGTQLPDTINTIRLEGHYPVAMSKNIFATTALIFGAIHPAGGVLTTGNYQLVTDTVIGATRVKFVVTDSSGSLKLNTVGSAATLFPVGPYAATFISDASSYNPVTISNSGAIENFAVSVKTTFDNPVPNANTVVNRQWTIKEDVAGGNTATISFSWLTADQAPGFNPGAAVVILQFNGATWVPVPAVVTGSGTAANPFVATAQGITSFSTFVVSNTISLPLTLLNFNAAYNGATLNLTWNTTREINTSTFEVERSADGRMFNSIAAVAATGLNTNRYATIDVNPIDGVAYYRLKMIDKDGSFKYSQVVVVNSKTNGVTLYPNPAVSTIIVTHKTAKPNTTIAVVSADGKTLRVQTVQPGVTQTSVDVAPLPKGAYLIHINNGSVQSTASFIKK